MSWKELTNIEIMSGRVAAAENRDCSSGGFITDNLEISLMLGHEKPQQGVFYGAVLCVDAIILRVGSKVPFVTGGFEECGDLRKELFEEKDCIVDVCGRVEIQKLTSIVDNCQLLFDEFQNRCLVRFGGIEQCIIFLRNS